MVGVAAGVEPRFVACQRGGTRWVDSTARAPARGAARVPEITAEAVHASADVDVTVRPDGVWVAEQWFPIEKFVFTVYQSHDRRSRAESPPQMQRDFEKIMRAAGGEHSFNTRLELESVFDGALVVENMDQWEVIRNGEVTRIEQKDGLYRVVDDGKGWLTLEQLGIRFGAKGEKQ